MAAHGYYLSIECRNCDNEIHYGVCVTTIEHNGLPVIAFDDGAQNSFKCDNCGATNYTGAFDVDVEGGRDVRNDNNEDVHDPDDAKTNE